MGGGGTYDVVITVDGAHSCARLWVQIALMSYYQQQQTRTTTTTTIIIIIIIIIVVIMIITSTTLPLIGDIYVFKKSCLQYLKYIEVMLKSDRMRHEGSSLSTLIQSTEDSRRLTDLSSDPAAMYLAHGLKARPTEWVLLQ